MVNFGGSPSTLKRDCPRKELSLGYQLDPPLADAAWLTSCVHSVDVSGLTVIVESTSSNSKSPPSSEPYWMTSVRFWALPVLPIPWMPTHWLPLLPSLVMVNV